MFNLEYIRQAETFFALQVPVYYYVKTKGSLCTQGLSISRTIDEADGFRVLQPVLQVRPGRGGVREKPPENLPLPHPPAAQTVLSHLEEAERDIAAARLNGLTPAQRETFEALSGKVQESIQIVLQ